MTTTNPDRKTLNVHIYANAISATAEIALRFTRDRDFTEAEKCLDDIDEFLTNLRTAVTDLLCWNAESNPSPTDPAQNQHDKYREQK